MKYFHGSSIRKSYFEGWYFKHQSGTHMIIFIPSWSVDSHGKSCVHLQIITEKESVSFDYSLDLFEVWEDKLFIKIGKNIFSEKGIFIDIDEKGWRITGRILYEEFRMLKYPIMGPFSPFLMECNHGVISLSHKLHGFLRLNGEKIYFDDGAGYIETDYGTSFPKEYLWSEYNDFRYGPFAVMGSVARIPVGNREFVGCIASILYKEKEYRIAAYLGGRSYMLKNGFLLVQGKRALSVQCIDGLEHSLFAPQNGSMKRRIQEIACGKVRYRFYNNGKKLFDRIVKGAGFEAVREIK